MSEDERPVRADIIDVLDPIDVPDARAVATCEDDGVAAHGSVGAHGRVDATGQHLAGSLHRGLRGRTSGRTGGGVSALGLGVRHACGSRNQRAASFAWYVMMMPAPARAMPVRVSRTTRRSSSQPFCTAAFT